MSAAVLPFTRSVRKGRKRVARALTSGAGELTIHLCGTHRPENVVSLLDYRAAQCDPDTGIMQAVLISAVIQQLDADTLGRIHDSLRGMGCSRDPEQRALGKALSRLTGGMIRARAYPPETTVFIRESDGKAFNVKGEAL